MIEKWYVLIPSKFDTKTESIVYEDGVIMVDRKKRFLACSENVIECVYSELEPVSEQQKQVSQEEGDDLIVVKYDALFIRQCDDLSIMVYDKPMAKKVNDVNDQEGSHIYEQILRTNIGIFHFLLEKARIEGDMEAYEKLKPYTYSTSLWC